MKVENVFMDLFNKRAMLQEKKKIPRNKPKNAQKSNLCVGDYHLAADRLVTG